MISRPRSLKTLKSVNLTKQIRDIIEQGPPQDLVANFNKLFDNKIKETRKLASQAAEAYGLLPESLAVQTQVDKAIAKGFFDERKHYTSTDRIKKRLTVCSHRGTVGQC